MADDTNRPVGYGRPPAASQFTKGRSGNPRGRPKGARSKTSVEKAFGRKVSVTIDGRTRRVPVAEALALGIVQDALAGDAAARRQAAQLIRQLPKSIAAEAPPIVPSVNLTIHPPFIPLLRKLRILVLAGEGKLKVSKGFAEAALIFDPSIILTEADWQEIVDDEE